ncbi:hypothetical protein [Frateuria sp. STR12]|uniref:hypothetical protein n=1 Tax=Frateuria hangzhouensis TaxID=2995589 RepID=UPI002260E0C4|nr:hypothetical protein [Frateuria sp. STR12]MCX7514648.1 hypothetical protein [Frateuria sp. STR12]
MDWISAERVVVALAWMLVGGCAIHPREPGVALAAHATGDGRQPETAVRFGPVRGGPLVFVMAELAWLDGHAYTRIEGVQTRTVLLPGLTTRFLHAWPVRDAGGHVLTIHFDMSQMVLPPTAEDHRPHVQPAHRRAGPLD